ncbi:MAG TPA: hypothetical protein VF407_25430 [Polyangiaceae bacterium]
MRRTRTGVVACALALTLAPSARAADVTEQCIADADTAQRARRQGHLAEAEKAAISCAQSACPGPIATDCKTWLAEIEAARPSIVVRATVDGADTTDVVVTIDDKVAAPSLDGRAITIDPGEHTFRFDHVGTPSLTQHVLVAEGERARTIEVAFSSAHDEWHVPVVTWILGGVGVAAAGTGAGFWIVGRNERSSLYASCGKTQACSESDEGPAKTKLVVGDVLVVAGAAAIAGAVVVAIASHASFRAQVDGQSASVGFVAAF